MRHFGLIALSFSLVLAACNGPSSTDSSKSSSSDKSTKTAKEDDKKSTGGGPATEPDQAGGVAVPKDPLVDYPTVYASCDSGKESGECIEYAEVGFSEDSLKSMCDGNKGTWAKGKNCPKEGKVAACNVTDGKNRHVYYKNYFGDMKLEDTKTLCTGALLGTWGEFPKK